MCASYVLWKSYKFKSFNFNFNSLALNFGSREQKARLYPDNKQVRNQCSASVKILRDFTEKFRAPWILDGLGMRHSRSEKYGRTTPDTVDGKRYMANMWRIILIGPHLCANIDIIRDGCLNFFTGNKFRQRIACSTSCIISSLEKVHFYLRHAFLRNYAPYNL